MHTCLITSALWAKFQRRDTGMNSYGEGSRIAPSQDLAVGIPRKDLWQHFDGNLTVQLGVNGAPDFSHATLAEFGGDTIMGDDELGAHLCLISGMLSSSPQLRPAEEWIRRQPEVGTDQSAASTGPLPMRR